MLERLRAGDAATKAWIAAAALATVVAVPLVVSGPGNDLDVANVFRSGRALARHLSYVPSRPPGAPVHELIVGVLDLLGGPLLTNLGSVVAAVLTLVGLHRLLRGEGLGRGADWAVALVAANPWFLIAATSTADYVFALAFVVWAALALRRGEALAAGLLAAGAMGCRIGSAALIAALLVAELTDRSVTPDAAPADRSDPDVNLLARTFPRPARVLIAGAVAVVATVVLFVPAFLAAGGLSFAENDFSTSTPLVQLGRALAKDLILLGSIATLVALAAVPALWRALRRWKASWLVRFAVVGLVLAQVLFVRFPWKLPHLLPTLLCLAVLLGVALDDKPRLLVILVALQLAACVVRVDVIQPDDPNQATGGRAGVSVGWGPVVTDWQCRREHPDAYRGRQKVEVEAAWDCAKPFSG